MEASAWASPNQRGQDSYCFSVACVSRVDTYLHFVGLQGDTVVWVTDFDDSTPYVLQCHAPEFQSAKLSNGTLLSSWCIHTQICARAHALATSMRDLDDTYWSLLRRRIVCFSIRWRGHLLSFRRLVPAYERHGGYEITSLPTSLRILVCAVLHSYPRDPLNRSMPPRIRARWGFVRNPRRAASTTWSSTWNNGKHKQKRRDRISCKSLWAQSKVELRSSLHILAAQRILCTQQESR